MWLVISSVKTLGKQWAIAARIVEEHQLITDGPYRYVRNPIYTGMFGMLLATGLTVTNWYGLVIASVVFYVGTLIRVKREEALLRAAFGNLFEDYARRVPALIPNVF